MIPDRDLLRVVHETFYHSDEEVWRLESRHFELSWDFRLVSLEAPSPQVGIDVLLGAFVPLFRAFRAMPFGLEVIKPLIQATMERLVPEAHTRLISISREMNGRRSRTGRLVAVPEHHVVRNFAVQGEVARQHMDRLEAAFREAREMGGRVDLTAAVVRPEDRDGLFINPDVFDPGRRMDWRGRLVPPAPRTNAFRDHARALEEALFADFMIRARPRQPYYSPTSYPPEVMARAKETLLMCLTPAQKLEFELDGTFTVISQIGAKFRILQKASYNVEDSDYLYCCVPANPCPVYDMMLASKCWLEADFHRFMKVANRHPKRDDRMLIIDDYRPQMNPVLHGRILHY